MGFWNTRGLRGSSLETLINFTNDFYRQKGLALFQKIPTPITPVKVNNEKRRITLAYFEQQSTVDYMGVVQGIPVCFDAKETTLKSLPIQNIHPHQIQFMNDFQKSGTRRRFPLGGRSSGRPGTAAWSRLPWRTTGCSWCTILRRCCASGRRRGLWWA